MTPIAEFVKLNRIKSNLSIKELSVDSDVSTNTLYRIENGLTIPSVNVMEKLAPILGVHINDLIDQLFVKLSIEN